MYETVSYFYFSDSFLTDHGVTVACYRHEGTDHICQCVTRYIKPHYTITISKCIRTLHKQRACNIREWKHLHFHVVSMKWRRSAHYIDLTVHISQNVSFASYLCTDKEHIELDCGHFVLNACKIGNFHNKLIYSSTVQAGEAETW
jgi:hypothetical protein